MVVGGLVAEVLLMYMVMPVTVVVAANKNCSIPDISHVPGVMVMGVAVMSALVTVVNARGLAKGRDWSCQF